MQRAALRCEDYFVRVCYLLLLLLCIFFKTAPRCALYFEISARARERARRNDFARLNETFSSRLCGRYQNSVHARKWVMTMARRADGYSFFADFFFCSLSACVSPFVLHRRSNFVIGQFRGKLNLNELLVVPCWPFFCIFFSTCLRCWSGTLCIIYRKSSMCSYGSYIM